MKRYYYKQEGENGSVGYLNLKTPLDPLPENTVELTEEEFLALTCPQPSFLNINNL